MNCSLVGRICWTVLFLAVGSANAQMRQNVPGVVEPPPRSVTDPTPAMENFRKIYIAAKKPRIAVFWNRAFNDELSTVYEERGQLTNRTRSGSSVTSDSYASPYGSSSIVQRDGMSEQVIDTRNGTKRIDNPQRATDLQESTEWRLEGGFEGPMISAGALLVDRATMMRLSKAGMGADERANVQSVEASALVGKADILMEILISRDPQSPTGYSYRVDAKRVADGTIVTRFVTTATPRSANEKHYYANERGFSATTIPPSADEVGEQLAIEAMTALATALRS